MMSTPRRLSAHDLRLWLEQASPSALSDLLGSVNLAPIGGAASTIDSPLKFVARDAAGRAAAVLVCSAPVAPDMVERSLQRARRAKAVLGPSLGEKILEPLGEGRIEGLSYAVLPYCRTLSQSGPVWFMQRTFVRSAMLDWLLQATARTARVATNQDIDSRFLPALRRVASHEMLAQAVREGAKQAIARLESGAWVPRHGLMHGDLWTGNILLKTVTENTPRFPLGDRLVIIDWPGSEIDGYAIYDLVRLGRSMRLSKQRLAYEMTRHCEFLQCPLSDAMSYVLAALGHIALNIEYFPMDRYVRLAEDCLTTVQDALQ